MVVTLSFLFFILAMVFHELGHALAMRDAGVKVRRLGLGLPLRPMITLRINPLRRIFGGRCRVTLSPWLLGAYAEPYREYTDGKRPVAFKDNVTIFGAGPIANLVMFTALSGLLALMKFGLTGNGVVRYMGIAIPGTGFSITLFFGVIAVLLWVFRRAISRFLLLPAGVIMFYLMVTSIMTLPPETGLNEVGGVVLISEIASKTATWEGAVGFGMFINLILGLTNLLPLGPLDGGRIFHIYANEVSPRFANGFARIGTSLLFVLIAIAMLSDGMRVFRYFA